MTETATNGRKRGRPSKFTQEIADEICRRLAMGESLRSICRDEGFPTEAAVRPNLNTTFRQIIDLQCRIGKIRTLWHYAWGGRGGFWVGLGGACGGSVPRW